ncbi:MAG: 50S ribosomal protein L4, partial [Dysosmobacter sp.]
APQWTHGGIVFAPKPRDYSYVLNKKVKRLALKSVLSAKAAEGSLVVVDAVKLDAIKTADFRKFLDAVKVDGKAVVVTPEKDDIVVKSARNIPGVVTTTATILSVYDILNAKYLVIDQRALATIEEVFA